MTDRARRYLTALPPAIAGSGGHDATFKAACALIHGFTMDPGPALPLLLEWNLSHCSPPWTESDLRHKLETAVKSASQRGRGYLIKDAGNSPSTARKKTEKRIGTGAVAPEEIRWPRRDLDSIRRIGLAGPGVADLFSLSPVTLGEMNAEEYVDLLFPGNPLLCVGSRMNVAETMPREDLRGSLGTRQFIVPSVMSAAAGKTQEGNLSPRTLTNTGPRSFLVIECDFSYKKADGSVTAEAPLLRDLAAAGVTVADLCAAVLLWLARIAPLAMIVSSGGKSLHGWFPCHRQPEDKLRRFMRYAVLVGADFHTWTPCQFVRMPEGQRDNGRRQIVEYFNPSVIR